MWERRGYRRKTTRYLRIPHGIGVTGAWHSQHSSVCKRKFPTLPPLAVREAAPFTARRMSHDLTVRCSMEVYVAVFEGEFHLAVSCLEAQEVDAESVDERVRLCRLEHVFRY